MTTRRVGRGTRTRVSGPARATLAVIALAAVLGVGALSGCGVPHDDTATAVPGSSPLATWRPPQVRPSPSPPPSPSSATSSAQLYFLDGQRLVPEPFAATDDGEPTPEKVLSALLAGPGRDGGATGSAIGPDATLRVIDRSGDLVRVAWSPGPAQPSTERLTLGSGQIVLSLTSLPGVRWVQFVDKGAVVGVPGPSGDLLTGPFRATDYEPLTEETPSSSP